MLGAPHPRAFYELLPLTVNCLPLESTRKFPPSITSGSVAAVRHLAGNYELKLEAAPPITVLTRRRTRRGRRGVVVAFVSGGRHCFFSSANDRQGSIVVRPAASGRVDQVFIVVLLLHVPDCRLRAPLLFLRHPAQPGGPDRAFGGNVVNPRAVHAGPYGHLVVVIIITPTRDSRSGTGKTCAGGKEGKVKAAAGVDARVD